MKYRVEEVGNTTGEVTTVAYFMWEKDAKMYCEFMANCYYSYNYYAI